MNETGNSRGLFAGKVIDATLITLFDLADLDM